MSTSVNPQEVNVHLSNEIYLVSSCPFKCSVDYSEKCVFSNDDMEDGYIFKKREFC